MRVSFLKGARLFTRTSYYLILSGFWLYAILWVAAWIAVFAFAENVHWSLIGVSAFILIVATPSLGELVRPYNIYTRIWSNHNREQESKN